MANASEKKPNDVGIAQSVLMTEIEALNSLSNALDENFSTAVDLITAISGYVIVTGVGKSGHIGRKIAATLASTGVPSFFVHPTEASHGDLGMIDRGSLVLAISNSGETREMRDILLYSKRTGTPIIAITSRKQSFLAANAAATLILPPAEEACPNRLAPTSSTTMTLALGDALAVAAMKRKKFMPEDFGARHPGGALGLGLQPVSEWMSSQASPPNPIVLHNAPFVDVLRSISDGRCGAVSVIDGNGKLDGIVTDGDIRRAVADHASPRELTAGDISGPDPINVPLDMRMAAVVEIFQTQPISQVIVVDQAKPRAMINVKELMQNGYF